MLTTLPVDTAELPEPAHRSEISLWKVSTIAQPRGMGQPFRPVALTVYAPSMFTALLLGYKQLESLNLTHGAVKVSAG